MIFHINHKTLRYLPKLTFVFNAILDFLTAMLFLLALFMLITGTDGIIAHESPDSLASFSAISSNFFKFFGLHGLIISGALGITLVIWFITRKIWLNSNDD